MALNAGTSPVKKEEEKKEKQGQYYSLSCLLYLMKAASNISKHVNLTCLQT